MADKKEKKGKTIAAEEWAAIHRTDVSSEVNQIMRGAYLQYSVSANIGRAIPDVRDGLKPVHRRILYAMYEDGLTNDKPFKKSATCVSRGFGKIISPSFVASNPANAAAATMPRMLTRTSPVPRLWIKMEKILSGSKFRSFALVNVLRSAGDATERLNHRGQMRLARTVHD